MFGLKCFWFTVLHPAGCSATATKEQRISRVAWTPCGMRWWDRLPCRECSQDRQIVRVLTEIRHSCIVSPKKIEKYFIKTLSGFYFSIFLGLLYTGRGFKHQTCNQACKRGSSIPIKCPIATEWSHRFQTDMKRPYHQPKNNNQSWIMTGKKNHIIIIIISSKNRRI